MQDRKNIMERIWAPWRIRYFTKKKDKECIFCSALKKNKDDGLVVLRSKSSFAVLNLYPYNNGHLMIVPNRHISDIGELKEEEIIDMFRLLNDCKRKLNKILKPQGYNIGINLGQAAGAGIIGHLHMHLVPRWNGDANFMSVVGSAKVISQSLKDLKRQLKKA